MTIGMVGLGKLGLPVALAIESKGHKVMGFDVNPEVDRYLNERRIPYKEKDLQPLLDKTNLSIKSLKELVEESDIVFCAIQTPHRPMFEGTERLPFNREDFNYSYLELAIKDIASVALDSKKHINLAVISTCLPGTFNKYIKPLLNEYVHYVYTPQFIAMGTVVDNYLNPEFALVGVEDNGAATTLGDFFKTIHDKPQLLTDITTAEAIKVSYNTFITMKTVLANTWGEIAHKVGAKADDIYKAWSLSTDRLLSPKYLQSGVGDGGGCHPRDNIALSYLAKSIHLSHDIFEDLMLAREDHMDWIAREAIKLSGDYDLPIIVLGRSFKPETNIETGSPAILLENMLHEYGYDVEHYDEVDGLILSPSVYVVGTKHQKYANYKFPKGSVVIDPFRYIKPQYDVKVINIGG